MNRTSKERETDTNWFSAIHDFPNVVSHIPSNRKERTPAFLEDEL